MYSCKLHFGTCPISDYDDLLTLPAGPVSEGQEPRGYPQDEFASPTRSTVALLSFLKHGRHLYSSALGELLPMRSPISAHLEFQVKARGGKGKASHTDLMLMTPSQAIAIEAKWTEPLYETVEAWSTSENRRAVLGGWLSLIQPHVNLTLSLQDLRLSIYQMVHRAASACALSLKPTLVYLQFAPLPNGLIPENRLTNAIEKFYHALGSPEGFRFFLATVNMAPTPAFDAIKNLPKGSHATAQRVREALRGDPLFEFLELQVRQFEREA